jgi:hypothetical protein
MSNREDARADIRRLQRALVALAADLDAIERRPHPLLMHIADTSIGIEGAVDHFAIAIERSRSGPKL